MRGFLNTAEKFVAKTTFSNVLEVGCGGAELAHYLFHGRVLREKGLNYFGIDIGSAEIEIAKKRCPTFRFEVASAYELPVADRSQDLVVTCEVLEHLEDPVAALQEISRIARGAVLLSVPCEPLWRVLNVLRGKYISKLGNTPGHVQHFSAKSIHRLASSFFHVREIAKPLPWTMILAETMNR